MSAKPEVPSVKNAVEHLQELASRMRIEEFGFESNDISNIDKVIESLQELENGVIHLREHLETETIKASVHRHKLQFLPSEVKREMTEAVNSARLSNKVALEGLKSRLDNINSNTVYLDNRQKVLEGENSVMHPERELIRKQHEEIICQLNQRLAEKAGKQITLNETRDKVRQANQTIVDLEDGILQLKEDLIQERAEARNEKKRLKKVVADTTQKNLTQLEQNYIKKKIVDELADELVSSDGQLEGLRKSIQRNEASRLRMEKQETTLEVKLAKELQESQTLRMKSSKIDDAMVREQTEFDNKERMLKEKIKELDENIHSETIRNDDLEGQKYSLHLDLDDKLLIRKTDTDRVKELDIMLQGGKQSLETKAVDVGKMQSENVEMQEQIVSLEESHKAIVSQLSKQIEEHRDQLGKERKERMELQSRRDSVQKNLDEYKMDNQKFMTDMNKQIIESKGQHVDLSNEGTQLQSKIREDSAKITVLQDSVTVATKEYEDMFTALQSKLGTMKTGIVQMETSLVEKKDTLETRTPVFEELERTFENRSESYDTIKKGIVTMKNKKSSLEDGVKRAKRDRDKMEFPQTQLRGDLKTKREAALVQMRQHAAETSAIERQIYVSGCKLKTVLQENHKFDEGISKLQSGIADLNQQERETEDFKGKLKLDIAQVKEQLLKGWDDDNEIETMFATRDQQIVNDLEDLVGKTERRGTKISEITSKLESELLLLSSFLDNVSSRRPKDTRESKRPQIEHREISDLSAPLVATPRSLLSSRQTKSTFSQ